MFDLKKLMGMMMKLKKININKNPRFTIQVSERARKSLVFLGCTTVCARQTEPSSQKHHPHKYVNILYCRGHQPFRCELLEGYFLKKYTKSLKLLFNCKIVNI